jgi:hypothetical protein
VQRNLVWITVILLICAALRFHGLVWTLPYLNDGDEWRVVNNGLSVYFTGHQSYETEMHNYPPLRSWEVASIRAGFVLFFG